MKSGLTTALAMATALALGCGGGEDADGPGGPIDPALAARGEQLFTAKGCTACHTIGGGRLVGPDLAGVSARRDFPFIIGMITNPDSMITNDTTAKALLAEYLTPMANQEVSLEEARALFEYFRSKDTEPAAEASGGA